MSDIGETRINTLLLDDKNDRRDLIAEEYQFQSDIETFEQRTGKLIQPEDDQPDLVDEIQMKDIARSH